jgi:hypothetical protein
MQHGIEAALSAALDWRRPGICPSSQLVACERENMNGAIPYGFAAKDSVTGTDWMNVAVPPCWLSMARFN